MNQAGEDKKLRDQLRREMEQVVFREELQAAVLKRAAAPKPSWWNREIRIPAPVVAAILLLIIAVPLYGWQQAHSMKAELIADTGGKARQEDRIIVSAAGVFYASQLERGER